jgi:DNA polymerase III delta prime subunit
MGSAGNSLGHRFDTISAGHDVNINVGPVYPNETSLWSRVVTALSHRQSNIELELRADLLQLLAARVNQQLENALDRQVHIALELHTQPDATAPLWRSHLSNYIIQDRPIPENTPIIDVFDKAGGQLLILGAPGAGKTTLLLNLARTLIERAQQHREHRIPVIVNLSSWKVRDKSIHQWLDRVLPDATGASRSLVQRLVSGGNLLLLFDGLDEVEGSQRADCIQAINTFCREYGPIQIVVCSRSNAYEEAGVKLQLSNAITIEPLSFSQVDEALSRAGKNATSIRVAVRADKWLRDLLVTPLMLNVAMLAYSGVPVRSLRAKSIEERRRQIFDAYIKRMFQQRWLGSINSQSEFLQQLVWLADSMSRHNMTEFLVERLQPSWVKEQSIYKQHVLLIGALSVTVFAAPLMFLSNLVIRGTPDNLINGLFVVMFNLILTTLNMGMFLMLLRLNEDIVAMEAPLWSWAKMRSAFPIVASTALVGLLIVTIFSRLLPDYAFFIWFLPPSLLVFWLVDGLDVQYLEKTTKPNQGMWRSFQNALKFGLTIGLASGLLTGLLVSPESGLIIGMMSGLHAGFRLGGIACIKHVAIRISLARSGKVPWKINQFLDTANNLLFLEPVGGAYRFHHNLLQTHFSSLTSYRIRDILQSQSVSKRRNKSHCE